MSDELNALLKNTTVRFAYRTTHNIKTLIHSTKTKIPVYQLPGIYKINCKDCQKFYIGQTGRTFEIRYKEHTRNSEKNISAFFNHLKTENHETDRITDAMEILHITPKGYHMNILEELEIYTHLKESPDEILNEQTELQHKHYLDNFIKIFESS